MQKRANRLALTAVLIAAGIIGGFFVLAAHQKAEGVLASRNDVSARLDRLVATVGDIAAAQQAYVAPGQPDQPWLERTASLIQQFSDEVAAARPRLRSVEAGRQIQDIGERRDALITIDGKARLDLQQGQELLAADLIFSEGRDTVGALATAIRTLGVAETRAADAERAGFERQQWMTMLALAAIWIVGLVALIPMASDTIPEPAAGTMTALGSSADGLIHADSAVVAPAAPAIDLTAAADVCASLARITGAAALPDILARAATVLDASGIIVWMGAGEELFPALAHGYDERVVGRLGAVARHADNATAAAWRTGQEQTVAADMIRHGAVAVPIFGVSGCVGVFAAEVRHGREDDAATRAVAAMIAAQLASVVSVWPAGSASAPVANAAVTSGPIAASGGA